jgi:hypothetical protein
VTCDVLHARQIPLNGGDAIEGRLELPPIDVGGLHEGTAKA